MTQGKAWAIGAAVYAVIGVFTFGHSAAASYEESRAEIAQCRRLEAIGKRAYCFDDSVMTAGSGGIAAGFLWPLYWSWQAQQ
jgi:hypothetical protein